MGAQGKMSARRLLGVSILAGTLAGAAGIAVAAGVSDPHLQAPNVPAVTTNARAWRAVADGSSGKLVQVGWVDPSRPVVPVTIRNSGRPGETTSVGYKVVLDDSGQPVGLLGPNGFVRGGVLTDGSVSPRML